MAAAERLKPNFCHTVRDIHISKVVTAVKSFFPYRFCALRYTVLSRRKGARKAYQPVIAPVEQHAAYDLETRMRRRHVDLRQAFAGIKRIIRKPVSNDDCHAVGYRDARQAFTIIKHAVGNDLYSFRDRHGSQAAAAVEHVTADSRHAVRQFGGN